MLPCNLDTPNTPGPPGPADTAVMSSRPVSRRQRLGRRLLAFDQQLVESVDIGLCGRDQRVGIGALAVHRSEEHTSELQSLMRISYAVFCLKKKNNKYQ